MRTFEQCQRKSSERIIYHRKLSSLSFFFPIRKVKLCTFFLSPALIMCKLRSVCIYYIYQFCLELLRLIFISATVKYTPENQVNQSNIKFAICEKSTQFISLIHINAFYALHIITHTHTQHRIELNRIELNRNEFNSEFKTSISCLKKKKKLYKCTYLQLT